MQLLATTQPAELPTDALLARLRCRRAAIDLAVDRTTETPPGEATEWVYRRLNRELRMRLGPFLDLLAMRNLVLALRYLLAEQEPPVSVQRNALLAKPLLESIVAPDTETIVVRLESALISDYPFVDGLAATWRDHGPGGVEQQLIGGILQHGLKRSRERVVRETLGYLVDMRNCLAVRKYWRWQVSQAPQLTTGGVIPVDQLARIWTARDQDRLAALVTKLGGGTTRNQDVVNMEQGLIDGLTRLLRRAGRDPLGLAVVIEYLWKTRLAAHNRLLRKILSDDRQEFPEEVLLL